MGLDLNTALISDTFDGLIKTTDGNVLTGSPLVITDGRGNDSSIALATAGNGVAITGTLTVNGSDISGGLATAQADITAIEAKTDFITVTGAVNLDTINTKAGFITVTQAVDLDTIESDIAVATAKTQYITVTQAVDLDTMESDILSAKTKTDYITISQAVNLDTVESGLATAQSDITAIEAKTDYITVSSNVNLNTIASDASAAKTKTDFLTVTQPVDLDTLESDVNVAKGDITAIEAKTDNITVTQAVNLDSMESDIADAKTKTDFITITQAVNLDTVESGLSQAQTDINQIEAKTNNITVTQAVNLDTMESDIAVNNAKNSYPAGDATKVGFISVTQAVDLDSMETDISNLSSNKYDKTGGTISGNVVVTGDLTVNGTTTTVNTQTLSVEDPLIELANQNAANTVDTGFYANYSLDAGVTTKYAGLFKDASDSDKFKLFKGLEVEPTSSVDTAGTGYAKGDLVIGDLEADNVTGTVTATSVLADGVTATTQSAGDNSTKVATTAYVDSIVTAQDLDFAGDSGTGAVDLDSQSLTIAGTANEIETSASGQTITIGLPTSVTVGTLNATTLGGTLSTAAQPNITSVGTLSSLAVSGSVGIATNLNVTGTLGVGTSTPDAEIHLKKSADGDIDLLVENTNSGTAATSSFKLETIGNNFNIKNYPDADTGNANRTDFQSTAGGSYFTFSPGTTEKVRIDAAGNVGIGTSSPSFALDVARTGSADVAHFRANLGGAGGVSKVKIDTSTSSGGGLEIVSNSSAAAILGGALAASIYQKENAPLLFGTNNTERMRIDSSGNVGIGRSSARGLLDLGYSGDGPLSNTTSEYQLILEAPSGTGDIGRNIAWSETLGANVVVAAINAVDEGSASATGLTFNTGNSGSLGERMRITSGGDLLFSTGLNFATQRVDSKVISSGSPQTIFDLSSENNGIYIVSVVRVSGSTGTRWIGFVAVSLGNCFIQGILESNGLTASTSGGDFQVEPGAGITVSATVRPMSID